MKLGRRAPRMKTTLKLIDMLNVSAGTTAPPHPARADNLHSLPFGMYANDRFGTCGPASVANSRILVTGDLGGSVVAPTQEDVFDLYRRSGNPSFDPSTGADDNGVDLGDMLAEVVRNGIGGRRAVAYASVNIHSMAQVRAAIDIFGCLILGVNLERAQQAQTDHGVWDFESSAQWGGHAVLAGAYTSSTHPGTADVHAISWARNLGITDRFWHFQIEECFVLLWPELLGTAKFDQHVNLAKLKLDFQALTGRTLVV